MWSNLHEINRPMKASSPVGSPRQSSAFFLKNMNLAMLLAGVTTRRAQSSDEPTLHVRCCCRPRSRLPCESLLAISVGRQHSPTVLTMRATSSSGPEATCCASLFLSFGPARTHHAGAPLRRCAVARRCCAHSGIWGCLAPVRPFGGECRRSSLGRRAIGRLALGLVVQARVSDRIQSFSSAGHPLW